MQAEGALQRCNGGFAASGNNSSSGGGGSTAAAAHRVGRGVRIMVSTTRVMMEGLPRMAHVLIMAF